jgi:hypothetical protein
MADYATGGGDGTSRKKSIISGRRWPAATVPASQIPNGRRFAPVTPEGCSRPPRDKRLSLDRLGARGEIRPMPKPAGHPGNDATGGEPGDASRIDSRLPFAPCQPRRSAAAWVLGVNDLPVLLV